MNKNGFGFPSIFTVFVLIMVVMVLALAQNNIDTKTIDKAIDSLNWTTIGGNVTASIQRSADNSPNEIVRVILNIINKAIDFFGYAIMEVGKLAMKLAKDNPDIINYKVLFGLIILSLIAPLIYPAFMIIVSLILIIIEYLKLRKEKKEIQKLKGGQNG